MNTNIKHLVYIRLNMRALWKSLCISYMKSRTSDSLGNDQWPPSQYRKRLELTLLPVEPNFYNSNKTVIMIWGLL